MKLVATTVDVRYPGAERPAVSGVSLTLDAGEFVAVVGPNGSGKTSLLRTLLGLVPPARGTVCLDDRPLAAWGRRAFAEAIGALPQREEPAFPLTVREAVLLGRWARLGPIAPVGAADERAVAEALDRCDVRDLERRTIDTLSGGEWQRVRLARALASSPRLLLLDEPTAALDLSHEMALFELLRRLVADGIGVLVITHQLNLVARYAGRIVLLDHGRVAADGPPATVLQRSVVTSVFSWPVAVSHWDDGSPLIVPLRRDEQTPESPPSIPPTTDPRIP